MYTASLLKTMPLSGDCDSVPPDTAYLEENLERIRDRIARAASRAGRQADEITLEDVLACTGDQADLSLDDLAQNIAGGRPDDVVRTAERLFAEGGNAVYLLRAIQNYFLRLHVTKARLSGGESFEAAVKKLQPPLFWKMKDGFARQVNGWSQTALSTALMRLRETEAECKTTGPEAKTLCARALTGLALYGKTLLARRTAT